MVTLAQKILTTLAYYDVMDYPMSAFEIWKYLIRKQETGSGEQEGEGQEDRDIKLVDIIKELEDENIKKHIEEYRGFYFLKDRQGLDSTNAWKGIKLPKKNLNARKK